MIALFGAPGSGKSLQGQLLAARHSWRWLSTGQVLRDNKDKATQGHLNDGKLIDDKIMFPLVQKAIADSSEVKQLVLDGFPRTESQAKWLLDKNSQLARELKLVIYLVVPDEELDKRLNVRGRADDSKQERVKRHQFFKDNANRILEVFDEHGVDVIRVSGVGTVGEVHDRIEEVLQTCSLE